MNPSRELKNSGRVEIVVARPILSEVERLLSNGQFHILHFIGHGDRDEESDEYTLVFVDGDGEPDLVPGSALGTILGRYSSLQLVLLNACEGARTDYRDPFKGVASALVKAGISVVVAMQGAITDGAASNFAGAFYEKLIAMAMPYDDALFSARRNLFAGGRKYLEWATPVLFSRTKNGQIFELPQEQFSGAGIHSGRPAGTGSSKSRRSACALAPRSREADAIRRLLQSHTASRSPGCGSSSCRSPGSRRRQRSPSPALT